MSDNFSRPKAWRWLRSILAASTILLLSSCSLVNGGLTSIGVPAIASTSPAAQQQPPGTPLASKVPAEPIEIAVDGDEERFIGLFETTNPSVVYVHVERPGEPSAQETAGVEMLQSHAEVYGFRGWVSDPDGGSGFVFDDDGHILTTNRVVAEEGEITVTFADGTTQPATVVGADPNTDLAILKVEERPPSAKPLELYNSDKLKVGQRVAALGNPLGYGGAMTVGIVSAKARNLRLEIEIDGGFFTAPDLIQADATVAPGMIGGPLIDLRGRVVGVVGIDTQFFDAASRFRVGGVGFSIPTSTVTRVVPALIENGRYPYPWLGISAMDMTPEIAQKMGLPSDQRGVLVVRVSENSPASKAELRAGETPAPDLGMNVVIGGDVITKFDGHPVRTFDELVSILFREGTVGETVALTVIRNGEQLDIPLTLEERP